MENSKLVLKDGTEFVLEAGSSLGQIRVRYAGREALNAAWDKLTAENLSAVAVKDGDTVSGSFADLTIGNPALTVNILADGALEAAWGIREKTEMERLAEQVAANTEAVAIHDGAIGDIAAVTSSLAEQAGEVE